MRLTFDIKDAKIVRRGLQDLQKETPEIGRLQIRRTVDRIVKIMRVYPPPPRNSTYQRTGRLGRSWKILRLGDTGYRIENNARFRGRRYTVYVVGDAYGQRQADVHKNRWNIFRDIVDQEFEKLPDLVDQHIHRVVRRRGWKAQ